jgi:hypothetical protein
MRPHHGTIQDAVFHVGIIGNMGKHLFPDLLVTPAGKPLRDAVPVPRARWQVTPRRTGATDPAHGLNEATAGCLRATIHVWTAGQNVTYVRPLIIA